MKIVHHILYEGVDTTSDAAHPTVTKETIGSVEDSPEFERKIFTRICDHSMDLDGLSHGDGVNHVASYRFTNFIGRHIKVTVQVVEQFHSDPALENGDDT